MGGRELKGKHELLFFWLSRGLRCARTWAFGVVAVARDEPMLRLPVRVPAVSPRELTGTAALKRGIPPGARGGIQILGMGLQTLEVFEEIDKAGIIA